MPSSAATLVAPRPRPIDLRNVPGEKTWLNFDNIIPILAVAGSLLLVLTSLLNNLASAMIHSAAFPQYRIRGVEQNIRFHLRQSPELRDFLLEAFDRLPMAGLALLSVKNQNDAETAADLRRLIEAAGDDEKKRAWRERLLHHLETAENTEPFALAKYSLERVRSHSLATCGAAMR